jgi:hypothetical protein
MERFYGTVKMSLKKAMAANVYDDDRSDSKGVERKE